MKLHVVDGTFELFRAHFSKRPSHVLPSGRPFKAVAGLISSLCALTNDEHEAVTHIAVAFDNPIRSFRNDLFHGYKTEAGVDRDLLAQFDDAEDAVRALGMVVWSMERFECDDALATAATRWQEEVEQVRILTPDKDLGQCLVGTRVVQVDRIRDRVIDEARFRASRRFAPESMPDFLALVGDSADGIPGIPGFGERSSATLLGRYVHLESIPADSRAWEVPVRGADRLAGTLAAMKTDALLYRHLATLVRDVPLRENLADLAWPGVQTGRFFEWCDACGLEGLKARARRAGA